MHARFVGLLGLVALGLGSMSVACSSSDDAATASTDGTGGGGGVSGDAGHAGTIGASGSTAASGHAGTAGTGAAGKSAGAGSSGAAGSSGKGGSSAGSGGSAGAAASAGGSKSAGAGGSTSGGGTSSGGGTTGTAGSTSAGGSGGAPASSLRVVGYLPNYSGSYADWAKKIDFTKMTHLNLAFATANGNDEWDLGASDADVKALVDAAHAHGTKVLASLGGGGGDQSVIARYQDEGHIPALIDHLDQLIAAHDLDGADVDIEDPGNLGKNYSAFVDQMVQKLHPKGKLVTAAVAQYLQDNMSDTTLHQFDFVNVMVYSSYADSVSAMDYYTNTKSVPKGQVVLGAGFFGTDQDGNEYGYADILAADGQAWNKDQATVGGKSVHYTGMASMKKLADYAKGYGGIMFWELSLDVPGSHSLYAVIQGEYLAFRTHREQKANRQDREDHGLWRPWRLAVWAALIGRVAMCSFLCP